MIVILGASGFIGQYMINELLENNEEIVATYCTNEPKNKDKRVKYIQLDICNKSDFNKLPQKGVRAVLMFAGRLPANVKLDNSIVDDSIEYVKSNIIGTLNALEYCRENNIKVFLYTSSYSDILGNAKDRTPIAADANRNFKYTGDHSAYIISKCAAIDFATHYSQEFDMQCIVFRLPPVYGVGPHGTIYVDGKAYKSGIQTFVENAKEGKDIELWGDPDLYRDIIYVKDLAHACYQAINSPSANGIYNISNGKKLYLRDQIKTIIEIFDTKGTSKLIYRPEKKNNSPSYVLDISKSKQDFGFEPKYSDFKTMMIDYKNELDKGLINNIFENRINK